MTSFELVQRVIINACWAGATVIVASAVILTVLMGGDTTELSYYGKFIVIYAGPVGLSIGALSTIITIYLWPKQKRKKTKLPQRLKRFLLISLPLIPILALLIIPSYTVNVFSRVTHGATWFTTNHHRCSTTALVLILKDFPTYNVICSPTILDYVQYRQQDVIPITYEVVRDHGIVSNYILIQVGTMPLNSADWIQRGFGGCLPYDSSMTCGATSPALDIEAMMKESTWPED